MDVDESYQFSNTDSDRQNRLVLWTTPGAGGGGGGGHRICHILLSSVRSTYLLRSFGYSRVLTNEANEQRRHVAIGSTKKQCNKQRKITPEAISEDINQKKFWESMPHTPIGGTLPRPSMTRTPMSFYHPWQPLVTCEAAFAMCLLLRSGQMNIPRLRHVRVPV